ncbi:MAG: hypothetical protein IJT06_02935 [Selenomonadaceae bacterium]|nr:hypothetical protein [Selenomonadaceae bacterium]
MTNASIMFTAFIVSIICSVIVFVAGLFSGVVRMGTLFLRTFYALVMACAATYFILMVFDWYYEKKKKKFDESQTAANDKPVEGNATENPAVANPQPVEQPAEQVGFKPLNPEVVSSK